MCRTFRSRSERTTLEHQLALPQPLFSRGHQGIFGTFIGRFVGDAESQEWSSIVPGHGDNRLLRDEILAGRFGSLELRSARQALWRPGVEEIGTSRHLAVEAAAAERGDEFFQPPLI